MDPWQAFLAERPIAVLSTVSADGMPHAVPVEVVVDEGRAYVWCQAVSHKARNAEREGRAALVAYKGHAFVLVRGPVRLLDDSDRDYARITAMFLRKYERDESYGNDTLIEISPSHVASDRVGAS